MSRGSDSTARFNEPVLASASRRPPPFRENAFAFSASALSANAMCLCLSSTNSGSFSPSTACFFCDPALVWISYSYTPSGETRSRSNTMASYVHSRTSGATGSSARSSTSTSHVLPNLGTPPFSVEEELLFLSANIILCRRCATFAAGELPAAPSTPRSL